MSFRNIKGYKLSSLLGYDLAISASGDNAIIDATDQADSTPFVGGGNVLQIAALIVQGTTATATLAKIMSSGGDLLASGYVSDTLALSYNLPTELAVGEGLKVNLGAANGQHVFVSYWKRAE